MKRILAILGVVFIVVLVAIGVFLVRVAATGSKLDASSKAFVDKAVPEIVGTWSAENMIKHASPQLLQMTNESQVRDLCKSFSTRLGPMVSYDGSTGESNTSLTKQYGRVVSARYEAHVTFQNGQAKIQMILLQDKSLTWSFLEFNVLSPALVH